jgi:Lon protease-like protein
MDDGGVTRIPLFPLRSVLCPGVALPLHVFEERYRLMVDRCLGNGDPFGVVLIHEGHEVGPLKGRIADIGTTAAIRQAGRYPDGRLDILTVGQQRFRLESVDSVSEPYLVGQVRLLGEPTGAQGEAQRQAERVGRRFLEYLELLQPEGEENGPEIEIEFELEVEAGETDDQAEAPGQVPDEGGVRVGDEAPEPLVRADGSLPLDGADPLIAQMDAADLSPAQRRELLMAAARRLTATDDPTALSYVLTALIQVDLGSRQRLLEAPDTVERLRGLDRLLSREGWFLRQGLRPIIIDAAQRPPRNG